MMLLAISLQTNDSSIMDEATGGTEERFKGKNGARLHVENAEKRRPALKHDRAPLPAIAPWSSITSGEPHSRR